LLDEPSPLEGAAVGVERDPAVVDPPSSLIRVATDTSAMLTVSRSANRMNCTRM
jgi:hypothetical protein